MTDSIHKKLILSLVAISAILAMGRSDRIDKFKQLQPEIPSPGNFRTASGQPGRDYWQQKVDYRIQVRLDDSAQKISGQETITYHNNSPDSLSYLWLQLDQNRFKRHSMARHTRSAPDLKSGVTIDDLAAMLVETDDLGMTIQSVTNQQRQPLGYRIIDTHMRVDLAAPLKTGSTFSFNIEWTYNIPDAYEQMARGGYELFPADGNYIYEVAQWFPRMVAYHDLAGWQLQPFLGDGEFTLEFGDYDVRITLPADFIATATGELINASNVLSAQQLSRLAKAKTAKKPVLIVTPEEAKRNLEGRTQSTKSWHFKATNVRDFAFACSRRFIWDAMSTSIGGKTIMAMSFYPNEANPLWAQYSTAAIVHTLDVYSRFTFPYPYPVAISVNGPVDGMEYPMICFNGPRPLSDGTYSEETKYDLISVIIHEIGHNFFPMVVNSDERWWTWMDEGLNSFLQTIAEEEWEEDYPFRRGEPKDITEYMLSEDQVPIMTRSDSLISFADNSYFKASVALMILRDTILGREQFDFAFREYARRWRFKRPMPADFFRTMEDASGVDLDWFWRGWFFSVDHTDIGIDKVTLFRANSFDPEVEKPLERESEAAARQTVFRINNQGLVRRVQRQPELKDFYNSFDRWGITNDDRNDYAYFMDSLTPKEQALLKSGYRFYLIDLTNHGGLVMPVILRFQFSDGSSETLRIPAEIWRFNPDTVSKLFVTKKAVTAIELDPWFETGDTDLSNNHYPREIQQSTFEVVVPYTIENNPMQRMRP